MTKIEALSLSATPLIRLTNPPAEMVSHLDEDFHPNLPIPHVSYDPKEDDYRKSDDIKSDLLFSEALKERDIFLSSMKSYQIQDKDTARARLGLISESKWQTVIDEIRKAEQDADVNGAKGVLGIVRKCSRKLGDSGAAFDGWLRMFPDDAYGSIICGGFNLIINAAVRHRELCEEVLDAVGEIPELIRVAEFSFREYRSDELNSRIAILYKDISQSLRGILEFYRERAPGRTKEMARNIARAIGKGPNYGKQIQANIETVRKSVIAVKQEADRCLQRRIGVMGNDLQFQIWQAAEHKDRAMENLRLSSEIKDQNEEGLKLIRAFHAGFKCQARKWVERDQREREEKQIQREEFASMRQQISSISQAVTPELIRRQGPSEQQLIRVLASNPETVSNDLQYILQEGELFSTNLQAQAGAFMASPRLQSWLTSDTSCCLFVQADSADDNSVSALSFVTSLLFQALQTSQSMLGLHFACGLHTDSDRDNFPSAQGMLQSLIVQLLTVSEDYAFSLHFIDGSLSQRLEDADLVTLCSVFEALIQQLPSNTTLFLIIDGVSFYETQDRVQGTCYAIGKFIEIVGKARTVVKLLVTSPGISGYVRKGFHDEEVLMIDETGDTGGDGFAYDSERFREMTEDMAKADMIE